MDGGGGTRKEVNYHPSLTPTTAKTIYLALVMRILQHHEGYSLLVVMRAIKTPTRDIHRLRLRHHFALSYLAASMGPN